MQNSASATSEWCQLGLFAYVLQQMSFNEPGLADVFSPACSVALLFLLYSPRARDGCSLHRNGAEGDQGWAASTPRLHPPCKLRLGGEQAVRPGYKYDCDPTIPGVPSVLAKAGIAGGSPVARRHCHPCRCEQPPPRAVPAALPPDTSGLNAVSFCRGKCVVRGGNWAETGLARLNPQSLHAQEEESVSSGRKCPPPPAKMGGLQGHTVGAFSISAPATQPRGGGLGVEGGWGWVAVEGPGLEAGGGLALGWVRERRLGGGFWLG